MKQPANRTKLFKLGYVSMRQVNKGWFYTLLKLYYSDSTHNFGDLLNKLLFEQFFQCQIQKSHYKTAHMFGIGSILQKLLLPKSAFLKQYFQKWQPELTIFGSGFIHNFDPQQYRITRHLKPVAVRGQLSLNLLQQLVASSENIVTGDAGIFASHLLDKRPKKQYAIGIIPHYTEQSHPDVLSLKNNIPHATFINVLEPPLKVLEQIAQCETILSSSLHGLIVADSLLIPNKHMLISDRVIGQGFKFQDYYSNYGIQDDFWSAQSLEHMHDLPTAIADAYQVQSSQIEEMQKRLRIANPFSH